MKYKIALISIFAFFLVTELILRFGFGFCDAVLYRESDKYEYIAQAGQDRYRFGAHVRYNSHSQRNDEEPDSTRSKVLGLGDSVIFGGTMVDQNDIASSIFSKQTGVQMLNISAGSWGPDNCAAYIREKGLFGAKAMLLVCSSHDAYDVMTHVPVVGIYPSYPSRQYPLAWMELIDRYLCPHLMAMLHKPQLIDPDAVVLKQIQDGSVAKKGLTFNPGFSQLKHIADSVNIPLVIYLHAEQGEVMAGRYNAMGQQIIFWARQQGVPLMLGLRQGERPDMYRDNIHFNKKGQRHLAECMKKIFCKLGLLSSNYAN